MADEHITEIWKDVEGFIGYRISNLGRLQSRRKLSRFPDILLDTWRDLFPAKTLAGYPLATLRRNAKPYKLYIHRLVLEAFVGPCPSGHVCCHYDGNPSNNTLSNLRWDTQKSNCGDTKRHGRLDSGPRPNLAGEKNHNCKLTKNQIIEIRKRRSKGEKVRILSAIFGVSEAHISRICLWQNRSYDREACDLTGKPAAKGTRKNRTFKSSQY